MVLHMERNYLFLLKKEKEKEKETKGGAQYNTEAV